MDINELIRKRRSVFPQMYIDKPIPTDIIEQILENANWAPTHKLTEPWRFKIFRGKSLAILGEYLAAFYKENTPEEDFSELKFQKTKKNPTLCACVIAICMQRHESVPPFEEIVAVGAAVQNMWLTCTAYNIGSYWSTPKAILQAEDFLDLEEEEHCLGLFYMGYYDGIVPDSKRSPIEDKVTWYEE